MSRIGICLDDFNRATVGEVLDYYASFQSAQRTAYRLAWDTARFVAQKNVQMHTDKAIQPTDVAWFPWDKGFIDRIKNIESPQEVRQRIDAWTKNVIDKIPDSGWQELNTQEGFAKLLKDGNAKT